MKRATLHLAAPLLCGVVACGGVDAAREDQLGDAWAAQVVRERPMVTRPEATRYLDSLGRALARVADATRRDWHFYLVDDSVVNAFAVPGGHVFVNRGLFERAESMSELAGVMGHEIAHLTLRHSIGQLQSRRKTGFIVTAFCTLTGWCSSSVAQVAINIGGEALMARHSRADEAAADSAAVSFLVAAGIDPTGVPRMFEILLSERRRSPTALEGWFASHPLEEDRVTQTARLIAALPPGQRPLLQNDAGFPATREMLTESRNR